MEHSGTYRQQAISTANLLREAADRLETSSSDDRRRSNLTSVSAGSSRAPTTNSIVTASQQPGTSNTGGVTQCGSAAGVRDRELRSLFNWTARSSTGTRKCCKMGSIAVGNSKKKIPTWSHIV